MTRGGRLSTGVMLSKKSAIVSMMADRGSLLSVWDVGLCCDINEGKRRTLRLCVKHLRIAGYETDGIDGASVIVYMETEMLHSVADHEIIDMQEHIICSYLLNHFLCDGDCGSLVFYDGTSQTATVVHDRVAPETLLPAPKFYLVLHESCRVAFMLYQEMDEMLPHPLFGSESYVTPAEDVENQDTLVAALKLGQIRRQIESVHKREG